MPKRKAKACKGCAACEVYLRKTQDEVRMLHGEIARQVGATLADNLMISTLRKEQEADDRSMGAQRERLIRLTRIVNATKTLLIHMNRPKKISAVTYEIDGTQWVKISDVEAQMTCSDQILRMVAELEVDTAVPPRRPK